MTNLPTFQPGHRVYVTDSALAALRDIMRKATGQEPAPNHHGTVESVFPDGTLLIHFDDGVGAPYPPDMVRPLDEGGRADLALAADGCTTAAKCKGYCGLHWERIRRHGNPAVEMPAVARQRVYFVLAARSRKIKIGLAADPIRRLAYLQTGSPEPLELLGSVPGGRRLETQLHRDLAEYCSHGEWFDCTDRVLAQVAHLLDTASAKGTR